MSKDLNALTREELMDHKKSLQKEMKAVEKALSTLKDREKKAALAAAEKAAAEHGFSLAELAGVGGRGGKTKTISAPKYRNPANPDQTWTGRGRRPDWIRDAIDNGEDLSKFEI
ncbi:H-NS histone family protein [Ponticoccus sp. SC2-23]|uniref:H-NS histone family protein n=1 Tax=Alexandriicola marinus TaxID=2081710 RepID=UPI000FD96131|nr:H-NS histone family protein [Alexandriicola marinus]MBM1220167.1 H-NS histone family protein [Ponticoccus sp. SC6-9]MBM1224853.1 H-NS histone family protein [Ponticoccus sp. SC6-15]MBM1228367.1 H-NS histone family protein [Ponticoccus sp. SC6-38]MBM1233996.1 H-NS histone family protein [Ponticoccus sp. SC6-45]MBM1238868.1 H-NS histone family protein [Ponticoccus sp. SC6-49]MBM1242650.1 H-NS histone family protein [Ponticoccus sp. SC2-64]MBM1247520.1 H-NS histone family protein [Ponticoccu